MFAQATPPELMVRDVIIICANPGGETHTATTGWDADNTYFDGKGDIARLFCEGGFIGQWTTYVSDNYTGKGRFYNGIGPIAIPTPVEPTPEPVPSPTPSPVPSPSETATVSVEPTPIPSPTVEPTPSLIPTAEPTPEPSPEPTPVPTPSNPPAVDNSAIIAEQARLAALEAERLAVLAREQELARLAQEEQQRQAALAAEQERQRLANIAAEKAAAEAEASRLKAEAAAKAAEEARLKAEAEAKAAEEAAIKAEQERLAAEAAAKKAEEERLAAEEEARIKAEEAAKAEADRIAAEEAAAKAEAEAKAKAEEDARLEAERLAAEEAAAKAEEKARIEAERSAAALAAKQEAERLAALAEANKPKPVVVPPVVATVNSTPEEKAIVAESVIQAAQGAPVTAEAIQNAGITYQDLPAATPVEVREDENGNEVVITAEVAAALVVLESPSELLNAIFTDPGEALLALASIGADMSVEEREESEKIIIASVIAGQAAVNAAGMAGAAAAYRRKP